MIHVELQKIIQSPQSIISNIRDQHNNFNIHLYTTITTQTLYQNSAVSDVATINVTDSTLLEEHSP